jgi:hypothetical protein
LTPSLPSIPDLGGVTNLLDPVTNLTGGGLPSVPNVLPSLPGLNTITGLLP